MDDKKTQISVECTESLKAEYEAAIKKLKYAGISESVREHMRDTIKKSEGKRGLETD